MRVLLLEVGHVELALADLALVQMTFDLFRRAILLPVVNFKALLHLVVLLLVPETVVCGFDPDEAAHRSTQVRCKRPPDRSSHASGH